MLNNLTNFFNLIVGRKIKSTPENADLIPLGTRDPRFDGFYQPTGVKYEDLKADILSDVTTSGCLPKFDFKEGSVGPKVSFRKEAGSDPVTNKDVIIPDELEITRGNGGGGIYNIAVQGSYNNNAPQYTYWNTQYLDANDTSWAPLSNIENRTYDTWRNAIQTPEGYNAPPQYVGMHSIMRFDNGSGVYRYWLIIFTEWGVGGYGEEGLFAYDRYEIFPGVEFTKPNYQTSTVDIVSPGVHIARGNNGPLYNAVTENDGEVGASPRNTRWNSSFTDSRPNYSGFNDLSNVQNRVYTDFTLALDYSIGNHVLNTPLVMHDLTTDLYYKVEFTQWTQGNNGGGFEYTRTVIPQSCGIKFADGSVMNTAASGSGGVQSVTGLNTDNTDPLNPIVQISVDGVTITGDGTSGNPLVAAGAGVAYANVFFVDGNNGNDASALQNNFTKPYLNPSSALASASTIGSSYTNRALVYIRRGTYTNQNMQFFDYVDVYCEPGVLFTGDSRIDDLGASVTSNFYGKSRWQTTIQFSNIKSTGSTSNISIEVDEMICAGWAFEAQNGANVYFKARRLDCETLGGGINIFNSGSGTRVIEISQEHLCAHKLYGFVDFSGKAFVTCPRNFLKTVNYYGGFWKAVINVQGATGGCEIIFNGNIYSSSGASYYAAQSGMIQRWDVSFGTLVVNGNIYAENQLGIYSQGSSSSCRTIINGDVKSNNLVGLIFGNSTVVFRNGTLLNTNSRPGSENEAVFRLTDSAIAFVENCHIHSLGIGALYPFVSAVSKESTASTLNIYNSVYSGADSFGFFIRNAIGGQPVNNVRILNSRSTKANDTNIVDLLTPTGFTQDGNVQSINFV